MTTTPAAFSLGRRGASAAQWPPQERTARATRSRAAIEALGPRLAAALDAGAAEPCVNRVRAEAFFRAAPAWVHTAHGTPRHLPRPGSPVLRAVHLALCGALGLAGFTVSLPVGVVSLVCGPLAYVVGKRSQVPGFVAQRRGGAVAYAPGRWSRDCAVTFGVGVGLCALRLAVGEDMWGATAWCALVALYFVAEWARFGLPAAAVERLARRSPEGLRALVAADVLQVVYATSRRAE